MKLKSVAVAVLIASGVASAVAATPNFPFAMPLAPQLPFSTSMPVFGSGSFMHDWSFTAPTLAATVSSSAISVDISNFYNIDDIMVSLFSGTAGSGTWVASGPVGDGSTLQNVPVIGGNPYYFEVTGKVTQPPSNGFYVFTAVSAPVPEPETYAMMLAGLGALGFLARRRKS